MKKTNKLLSNRSPPQKASRYVNFAYAFEQLRHLSFILFLEQNGYLDRYGSN